MKKILKNISCICLSLLISGLAFAQGGTKYGKAFKPTNSIVVSDLVNKLGKKMHLKTLRLWDQLQKFAKLRAVG